MKTPMRKCIGCSSSYPQDVLIRFVEIDGGIHPDLGNKQNGRGMYLCKNIECLEKALKKDSFNRACKKNVNINIDEVKACYK